MYASLGAPRKSIRRLPALASRVAGMRPDQREHYMPCRRSADRNAGIEQRCYEEAMMLVPTTAVIEDALQAEIDAEPGVEVPTWTYYAGGAVALVALYAIFKG